MVVEVPPRRVASAAPHRRGNRPGRIAVEPAFDVVVVELLGPQHAGKRLPEHHRFFFVGRCGRERVKEIVGLALAIDQHSLPGSVIDARAGRRESQRQLDRRAGRHHQLVPKRRLRASCLWVDRWCAVQEMVTDAIFRVCRR